MPRILKPDMKVRRYGDTWRIVSLGCSDHPDHPGEVFCYLVSTTIRYQKNGQYPVQIGDWVKGVKHT